MNLPSDDSMHRWMYLDAGRASDAAYQRAMLQSIRAWWAMFDQNAAAIRASFRQRARFDVPGFMEAHLQTPIDDRLRWEFGRVDDLRDYLVITPETDRHLRPLVHTILELAPRLPGWRFDGYRPAVSEEMASLTVDARIGGDLEGWTAEVKPGKQHRVDVRFFAPSGRDDLALDRAFVAAESLLGERNLDAWAGIVRVDPPRKKRPGRPLSRLLSDFEAAANEVRDALPGEPIADAVREGRGVIWELDPASALDYPEQRDLWIGKSTLPDMWTAAHADPDSFFSERFTRFGEVFCYVKLDGSEGLDEEKFADKAEIEDALDAALRAQGCGAFVGGGTGLKYSYVDLALSDVQRGIDIVRDVLRAGNVPKRSWIQFFDAYLAAEWVGIYPDSPEPPMPER